MRTLEVCGEGVSPVYAGPNLYTDINTGGANMKEKTMANSEQYRAVLDDLLKQRNQLQFKIGEIDSAVAALRRLMPPEEIIEPKDLQIPMPVSSGKYVGMSNRWAVLNLLCEDAIRPMDTASIAEALAAGGIVTRGKSLASNVSAVLSDMAKLRGEVESTDGKWTITQRGKESWIHIKASRDNKPSTMLPYRSPTSSGPLSTQ